MADFYEILAYLPWRGVSNNNWDFPLDNFIYSIGRVVNCNTNLVHTVDTDSSLTFKILTQVHSWWAASATWNGKSVVEFMSTLGNQVELS